MSTSSPTNVAIPYARHAYGTTQLDLPDDLCRRLEAIADEVHDRDLAPGESTEGFHATCLYGLTHATAEDVATAVAGFGPVTLRLGRLSLFKNDEHEVLKISVDSPDLVRLNERLARRLEHVQTHSHFSPHVSIAFLRPGRGRRYTHLRGVEGWTCTLGELTFSDADGNTTVVPLDAAEQYARDFDGLVIYAEDDPTVLAYALEDWDHRPGPRSQNRWVNRLTQKVWYGEKPPGTRQQARQDAGVQSRVHKEAEQVHAREQKADVKAGHVQAAHLLIRHLMDQSKAGELNPNQGQAIKQQLVEHLTSMTVKEIGALKEQYGFKASGVKLEVAAKVASRALGIAPPRQPNAIPRQPRPPRQAAAAATPLPWEGGNPEPGKVYNAPTGSLAVDPTRFQFKLNTNAAGVTDELAGVKTFNPDFAGTVSVWKDPANGKTMVVNGHHRHELASRTGHPELSVRYIEAKDAREARAKGALINLAEGRGTAVDAAKFMRDMQVGPDDLEARGVSLKGKLAADAAALTHLNDRQFDRLARGLLSQDKALAVAKHLHNPDLQDQLFSLLAKREDEGKDLAPKVIEEMAMKMAAAPTVSETTKDLFGDITEEKSLFVPIAEVQAHVRSALGKEVNDFLAIANAKRAGRVAGAGNVLNVEENRRIAQEGQRVQHVYEKLVNRKGPIADAINEAGAAYAGARTKEERDAIRKRAVEAVRDAVFAEAGVGQPGAGPAAGAAPEQGGTEPVGAGRPGAGEAEPAGAGAAGGRATAPDGGGATERAAGVRESASAVPLDVRAYFARLPQVESDGYPSDSHTGEVSANHFFQKTTKGEMAPVVFAVDNLYRKSGTASQEEFIKQVAAPQEVAIADLKSTQPTIEEGKVAALLSPEGQKRLHQESEADWPVVVRSGGQLYAWDGQHRIAAKKLNGETTVKAHLIDLDAGRPLTATDGAVAPDAGRAGERAAGVSGQPAPAGKSPERQEMERQLVEAGMDAEEVAGMDDRELGQNANSRGLTGGTGKGTAPSAPATHDLASHVEDLLNSAPTGGVAAGVVSISDLRKRAVAAGFPAESVDKAILDLWRSGKYNITAADVGHLAGEGSLNVPGAGGTTTRYTSIEPKPPSLDFTGTDDLGRVWEDGQYQDKQKPAPAPDAGRGGERAAGVSGQPAPAGPGKPAEPPEPPDDEEYNEETGAWEPKAAGAGATAAKTPQEATAAPPAVTSKQARSKERLHKQAGAAADRQEKAAQRDRDALSMTRQEFVASGSPGDRRANLIEHKRLIREALAAGQPVPENVLLDYPDLHQEVKDSKLIGKPLAQHLEGRHSPESIQKTLSSRLTAGGERIDPENHSTLGGGAARSAKEHYEAVKRALAAGKPVPPEVLADYQDLAAKQQPPVSGAAPGATPPSAADFSSRGNRERWMQQGQPDVRPGSTPGPSPAASDKPEAVPPRSGAAPSLGSRFLDDLKAIGASNGHPEDVRLAQQTVAEFSAAADTMDKPQLLAALRDMQREGMQDLDAKKSLPTLRKHVKNLLVQNLATLRRGQESSEFPAKATPSNARAGKPSGEKPPEKAAVAASPKAPEPAPPTPVAGPKPVRLVKPARFLPPAQMQSRLKDLMKTAGDEGVDFSELGFPVAARWPTADPKQQPRAATLPFTDLILVEDQGGGEPERIGKYAALPAAGQPRLNVVDTGSGYVVINGYHRLGAAVLRGDTSVPVNVYRPAAATPKAPASPPARLTVGNDVYTQQGDQWVSASGRKVSDAGMRRWREQGRATEEGA